jgi:hypothetical protein
MTEVEFFGSELRTLSKPPYQHSLLISTVRRERCLPWGKDEFLDIPGWQKVSLSRGFPFEKEGTFAI